MNSMTTPPIERADWVPSRHSSSSSKSCLSPAKSSSNVGLNILTPPSGRLLDRADGQMMAKEKETVGSGQEQPTLTIANGILPAGRQSAAPQSVQFDDSSWALQWLQFRLAGAFQMTIAASTTPSSSSWTP
ncbi:hypothetical protein OUZ56_031293 [Daphnia magna]|uniref:Uncharacterized protein n=1 Tax=Daphnia magna TaxID=35525 RepID=A0ABQ9ZTU4_9CRUS|nr:hypothetical protein OUZ56_031293 [Daphnia magna]